jgi:hypothetical protein
MTKIEAFRKLFEAERRAQKTRQEFQKWLEKAQRRPA